MVKFWKLRGSYLGNPIFSLLLLLFSKKLGRDGRQDQKWKSVKISSRLSSSLICFLDHEWFPYFPSIYSSSLPGPWQVDVWNPAVSQQQQKKKQCALQVFQKRVGSIVHISSPSYIITFPRNILVQGTLIFHYITASSRKRSEPSRTKYLNWNQKR